MGCRGMGDMGIWGCRSICEYVRVGYVCFVRICDAGVCVYTIYHFDL